MPRTTNARAASLLPAVSEAVDRPSDASRLVSALLAPRHDIDHGEYKLLRAGSQPGNMAEQVTVDEDTLIKRSRSLDLVVPHFWCEWTGKDGCGTVRSRHLRRSRHACCRPLD